MFNPRDGDYQNDGGHLASEMEDDRASESEDNDNDNDDPIHPKMLKSHRPSFIGRIRTVATISVIEWSFILFSAVSIGVGLGFTLFRLLSLPPNSDHFVFALLVLANLCFATLYLFHGVGQEQPFEILMFIVTSFLLWLFITMNYLADEKDDDDLKLARFLVSTILTLPNICVAIVVGWNYWTTGNLVFKTVGGDMRLQRMYRIHLFGVSLLAFDAHAALSCLVLSLQNGISGMTGEEGVVVFAGAVFVGTWLMIGYVSIRTENIRMVWLFWLTSIVQPAFVVYLYVKGLQQINGSYSIRIVSSFIAGVALIIAHFALLGVVNIITFYFGKGLKQKVYGVDSDEMDDDCPCPPLPSSSPIPGPSRLSVPANSSRSYIGASTSNDREPLIKRELPQRTYDAIVIVHNTNDSNDTEEVGT